MQPKKLRSICNQYTELFQIKNAGSQYLEYTQFCLIVSRRIISAWYTSYKLNF